ncbi:hypothetical protein CSKR_112090, partial [Clonorchis sinensis]
LRTSSTVPRFAVLNSVPCASRSTRQTQPGVYLAHPIELLHQPVFALIIMSTQHVCEGLRKMKSENTHVISIDCEQVSHHQESFKTRPMVWLVEKYRLHPMKVMSSTPVNSITHGNPYMVNLQKGRYNSVRWEELDGANLFFFKRHRT